MKDADRILGNRLESPLSDDVIPDVDEEELTRDKVKKASNQLMNQQEKKKKKPKRRAD